MQPPEPNRDALRMAYLLALPAVEAQAFFWNYTGRNARRNAIDAAMARSQPTGADLERAYPSSIAARMG